MTNPDATNNISHMFMSALVTTTPDWMADAACQDDTENNFIQPSKAGLEAAQSVCEQCPVQAECEAYGEERDISFGVFGGQQRNTGNA